jgi:hypothetical protein
MLALRLLLVPVAQVAASKEIGVFVKVTGVDSFTGLANAVSIETLLA